MSPEELQAFANYGALMGGLLVSSALLFGSAGHFRNRFSCVCGGDTLLSDMLVSR
jgi:hypothetical protein